MNHTFPSSNNHNHNDDGDDAVDDPTQQFINALQKDLPLIMSGSGDTPHPSQTNPATVQLLATLTAQYVDSLVAAAVDAHDILTDGHSRSGSGREGVIPKPSFLKNKMTSISTSSGSSNWEEELPVPKIGKKSRTSRTRSDTSQNDLDEDHDNDGDDDDDDDDDDIQMSHIGSQPLDKHQQQQHQQQQQEEQVYAKGIELYPHRIRNEYQGTSSFIGLQSFIFPICHDAEMYTRVKDHKTFKRQLDEILIDPGIMKLVSEENDSGDFLAQSLFHFVNDEKDPQQKQEEEEQQQQQQQQQKSVSLQQPKKIVQANARNANGLEKSKVSSDRDVARRKEMARRLVARTGLEPHIPGVEEMLVLPMHTTKDLDG